MATMLTDGFRSTSPTPVGLILIPPRFLNHWCAQSSCFSHARSYYSSALKQPDRDPAQACWNTAHTRGRTNRRYTLFILRREFQRTKSLPGFFAGDFALLVYGIGRGNRSLPGQSLLAISHCNNLCSPLQDCRPGWLTACGLANPL